MEDVLPPRPAGFFRKKDGFAVPFYLVSFDKDGNCISPETRQALLDDACSGCFSDLHIYSHGWCNTYRAAVDHYSEFFTEYFELLGASGRDRPAYKPLVAGIIWPSTVLLAPWERTPAMAGGPHDGAADQADLALAAEIAEIAAALPADQGRRLQALAAQPGPLSRQDSDTLATLLAPLVNDTDSGESPAGGAASRDDLLAGWGVRLDDGGGRPRGAPAPLAPGRGGEGEPRAAGIFADPREVIRKATVLMMKDRAGGVGARGVAGMLRDVLRDTGLAVHLAGHSYGAKVVLSALAQPDLPRKVASVLLLQPAVNAFCFAARVGDDVARQGAYRQVLERSETPVFSTFSRLDVPLTEFFQFALRRDKDLGEGPSMAAGTSLYAALGGAGPRGLEEGECATLAMRAWPEHYELPDSRVRVVALDGSHDAITLHGDVRNPYTEWAMITQVFMSKSK